MPCGASFSDRLERLPGTSEFDWPGRRHPASGRSQEQVATNQLVGSLERQAVLETLLEKTKPSLRVGTESLHYLLAMPFRYPPLKHGSRFGTRSAPSLFYGSQKIGTVLAESAYYRFLFWVRHGHTADWETRYTAYLVWREISYRKRFAASKSAFCPICRNSEQLYRIRPSSAAGRSYAQRRRRCFRIHFGPRPGSRHQCCVIYADGVAGECSALPGSGAVRINRQPGEFSCGA